MVKRILNFVKYNNSVAIIISLVFGGASLSLAASPTVRDSVFSSTATVTSIDNHAIISADLSNYDFGLKINAVTEDDHNYYVAYSYQTMAVVDSVWQNTTQDKTLMVSKVGLAGGDLGLYVAKQLGDNIKAELSYLQRVQDIEKNKGESSKVVTTQYSGLIGKFIDPKQEVIEGYSPVVPAVASTDTAPVPTTNPADAQNATQNTDQNSQNQQNTTTSQTAAAVTSTAPSDAGAPSTFPTPHTPPPDISQQVDNLLQQNNTPATTPSTTSTPSTTPTTAPDTTPTPDATSTPTTTPAPSTNSTATPDATPSTTATPPSQ